VTATDVAGARDDERYATRRHQPALDGLRGLAVAGVLLFHGGHLTGGYLGVDAFFVLSGFLITSLLLAEVSSTSRISLSRFWARRARRLLPALACVLAAVALYAVFLAHDNELSAIRGDALATIAYVANWRQIFTSNDYWALFRSPSPLQHTWSLSIEEQFYVLWPLVVVGVTRGRSAADAARRVLVTALAGTAVSFVVMQLTFDAADTSRAYYGTDTRMSSILIGAALAAWLALRGPVGVARRKHLEGTAIAGAVVLALAWSHLSGTSAALYRGGFLVCAVATVLLIAAGVHPDRGPVAGALSWRPIRELGLISYGVYLWHWPIYVVVDADRAHVTGWPLLLIRILITLVVSWASFRFVERPIRYGTRSTRLLLQAAPIVALTLVVAIVASTAGATSHSAAATTNRGGLLLVGDSVANSLFPGIVRAGIPAKEVTQVGCRLLAGKVSGPGVYPADCPWREEWRSALRQQDPDVVLMVIGAWDLFDIQLPGSDHVVTPGSAEWNAYYARQLEAAISLLTARGAHLVIPTLPCNGGLQGAQKLADRSSFNVARVKAANAVLAQVVARHRDTVESPDVFGLLCPGGTFQRGAKDVEVVRSDGVHYTDEGAALLAAFLAPSLRDAKQASAAAQTKLVFAYGDAVLGESREALFDALPTSTGVRLTTSAQPFAAVCDMTAWLKRDLAVRHPALIVLETTGGDSTPCMRDASGKQIARDSPSFYAKFEADVTKFFSTARAAGAPILVTASPPQVFKRSIDQQSRLSSILVKIAQRFPGTIYTNLARDAVGGSKWTATLPCLASERTRADCHAGRIAVRGPDRVHFCPTSYASLSAFASGCKVYASGAVRYGRAIAEAILAGPTNNAHTHTVGATTGTTVGPDDKP
jgi:peptidoglycan/LPS O-acetylase OafA/YrhL